MPPAACLIANRMAFEVLAINYHPALHHLNVLSGKGGCMRVFGIIGMSIVLLSACGGHEVVRPTVSVSIGQQLIDLKKARTSGALTQSEYDHQRQMLIDSVE